MKTLTKKYDYEKVRNGKKSSLRIQYRNRYRRRTLTPDLVINFKNESIFWTLFIFINAKLGNLGI